MSKDRKGFMVEREGKLYVRVCYKDGLGKSRELMRRAKDRKHARQLRKELVKQADSANREDQITDVGTDKTTFAKIAERYEAAGLIPAQYVGDTKIAGLRSLRTPKGYLKRLVDHFEKARIRSITYSQVDEYRLKRLKEGVSIASTNRELALLRAVFNFAKRDGLISRTPFEKGVPLISLADEVKRDRVLSQDEEQLLLTACADPVRAHLKPLIIAAVDTGMRKGEILSLEWQDVDFENRSITVRAMNTKTLTPRVAPISTRLLDTLQSLYNEGPEEGAVSVPSKTSNGRGGQPVRRRR